MKVMFCGGTTKQEVEKRIKTIAAAGKLSQFDGDIFECMEASQGYDKDLRVIERITSMGHESILEHDYLVFALHDVTPIVEQTLIGFRLASFTVKSRRYVDFSKVGYYVPAFRNAQYTLHMENKELRTKYRRNMSSLFKLYADMVEGGIPKEDARFVLPYSFHSDFFMGLDGRELKKMILYLLYGPVSKIQELHDLGEKLLELAEKYAPYLHKLIQNYKPKELYDYASVIEKYRYRPDILRKPILLDYTASPDDVVLELAIMAETQCNYDEADTIISKAIEEDKHFKEKYLDAIMRKVESRELEQVNFTFQIPISLSILTHLTRHRMHSLNIPNFVPLWNFNEFVIPKTIQNSAFLTRYQKAIEKNQQMAKEFKRIGVVEEDLIYFYLGCQMCNVITTMNARSLMWISRMRACNRAQWQIRENVNYMIEEVRKVAPLIGRGLGPTCVIEHFCPEGKKSCGLIQKILAEEK